MAVEIDLGPADQFVEHFLLQRVGHQSLHEREQAGRYGIVGVLSRLGIQEHSIIGILNPRSLLQIGRNVLLMAGYRGKARHHVQQTIEKARPDEPSVRHAGRVLRVDQFGTLGRHAPVAVNVLDDDVVFDQTLVGIVDPLLHRRIVLADRLFVAVLVVQHIDDAQVGRRIRNVLAVERPVSRRQVGNHSVGKLRVANVASPFLVKQRLTEHEALADALHRAVAEPAHALVALRTVGRHAAVVASQAPVGVPVHLIDRRVGRLETSRRGHRVVDDFSFQLLQVGLRGGSGNLDVTETVISETRRPRESSVLGGRVQIGRLRPAQVVDIEVPVVLQRLGEAQPHGSVLPPLELDGEPADHVLSHVDDPCRVVQRGDRNRLDRIHNPDIRIRLSSQPAFGSRDASGIAPRRVVVAVAAPTRHFETGVVRLAVVLVVGNDRAVGRELPVFVARDDRPVTFAVRNFELGQQFRIAVVADSGNRDLRERNRISDRTHREKAAVAQNHADRIDSFVEQVGHVIHIVTNGFRIVGSRRRQHVLAYAATVQIAFVEAEPADVEPRLRDIAPRIELLAQIARGQARKYAERVGPVQAAVVPDPPGLPVRVVDQRDGSLHNVSP